MVFKIDFKRMFKLPTKRNRDLDRFKTGDYVLYFQYSGSPFTRNDRWMEYTTTFIVPVFDYGHHIYLFIRKVDKDVMDSVIINPEIMIDRHDLLDNITDRVDGNNFVRNYMLNDRYTYKKV